MIPLDYSVKRVAHMEVGDVMCLLDCLCLVINITGPSPIGNIRFDLFDLECGVKTVHTANMVEHFRVFG